MPPTTAPPAPVRGRSLLRLYLVANVLAAGGALVLTGVVPADAAGEAARAVVAWCRIG